MTVDERCQYYRAVVCVRGTRTSIDLSTDIDTQQRVFVSPCIRKLYYYGTVNMLYDNAKEFHTRHDSPFLVLCTGSQSVEKLVSSHSAKRASKKTMIRSWLDVNRGVERKERVKPDHKQQLTDLISSSWSMCFAVRGDLCVTCYYLVRILRSIFGWTLSTTKTSRAKANKQKSLFFVLP